MGIGYPGEMYEFAIGSYRRLTAKDAKDRDSVNTDVGHIANYISVRVEIDSFVISERCWQDRVDAGEAWFHRISRAGSGMNGF